MSWAHLSGRVGSTDRSVGLLVGRACLSGMAEILVGGDPWVPMSHTYEQTPNNPEAESRLKKQRT
jgi:hypothetical protein